MKAPPSFRDLCEELLRAGQPVRFTATGASMAPAIRAGDVLLVEPVPAVAVRVGDVILYRAPRGLTAHRIVALSGPAGLVCQGDARGSGTEVVPAADVLGRVTDVEAGQGRLSRSLGHLRAALRGLVVRLRALLPHANAANPAACPECHQSGLGFPLSEPPAVGPSDISH